MFLRPSERKNNCIIAREHLFEFSAYLDCMFLPFIPDDVLWIERNCRIKSMKYGLVFILLSMSFGEILSQHTNEAKIIIRSIEKSSKKLINAKHAVAFNEQCTYKTKSQFLSLLIFVSTKEYSVSSLPSTSGGVLW